MQLQINLIQLQEKEDLVVKKLTVLRNKKMNNKILESLS